MGKSPEIVKSSPSKIVSRSCKRFNLQFWTVFVQVVYVPSGIYWSGSTLDTPKQCVKAIVNLEQISHTVLIFSVLTSNNYISPW